MNSEAYTLGLRDGIVKAAGPIGPLGSPGPDRSFVRNPGMVGQGLGALGSGAAGLLDILSGSNWGTKNLLRGDEYHQDVRNAGGLNMPKKIQAMTGAKQTEALKRLKQRYLKNIQTRHSARLGGAMVLTPLAYMLGRKLLGSDPAAIPQGVQPYPQVYQGQPQPRY